MYVTQEKQMLYWIYYSYKSITQKLTEKQRKLK